MKARGLIECASYGPDTLKALFRAFDEAWTVVGPHCGTDAPAIEAARIRLANILLSLAKDDSFDIDGLRDAALQRYQAVAGDRQTRH